MNSTNKKISKSLSPGLVLIFAIIFFKTCKDDKPSKDEIKNLPPEKPVIQYHSPGIDSTYIYWTCEDPDGDTLVYDFFFGKDSVPKIVLSKSPQTRYDCNDPLEPDTDYYCRVKAYDTDGDSSESDIFKFKAGSSLTPLP